MTWKTALRGVLIGLILAACGVVGLDNWRLWFGIITLNLVCHLR